MIQILVNGEPLPFEPSLIPAIMATYAAALRAEHYAKRDCQDAEPSERAQEFQHSFGQEMKHAMRNREEIEDWMQNNMDIHDAYHPSVSARYQIREEVTA